MRMPIKDRPDVNRFGIRFFSHDHLANVLGITPNTLTQWSKTKKAPPYIWDAKLKTRIYPQVEVHKWYAEKIQNEICSRFACVI